MKYGVEVEGRFCGLVTLFCDYKELITTVIFNSFELFAPRKINGKIAEIQQLYISDHDNLLDLNCEFLEQLSRASIVCTVERTALTAPVPSHINILLALPWDSFQYLNKNDQIKFSNDQHVYSCTKRQMVETLPVEFENDQSI